MANQPPAKAVAVNPAGLPDNVQIPHAVFQAQQFAKAQADAAALKMDETVPGGRYLLNGQIVDCNGNPVAEEKAKTNPANPTGPTGPASPTGSSGATGATGPTGGN